MIVKMSATTIDYMESVKTLVTKDRISKFIKSTPLKYVYRSQGFNSSTNLTRLDL